MSVTASPATPPACAARRTRTVGLAALAAAAATAVAAVGAGPVSAVAPGPEVPGSSAACPAAWSGPFADDQAVVGLTTVRGTTPISFTGTYLDTVPDGIGRGRDMLVFRLAGEPITDAGGDVDAGVWAGMSGSPVYDKATGALVGAVSYARSFANDVVAGVTPAADMYDELLDPAAPGGPPTPAPRLVHLTRDVRGALAADGVRAPRSSTLRRLDPPISVSGLSPERARSVAERARRSDVTYVSGAAASAAGPDLPIEVGGNIATASSYGDLTLAAIGSVTAVCGDRVLAMGHPVTWSGASNQSVHGARALGVSSQGGFGAFKDISVIGAPVGRLTHDQLEGVAGTLGAPPEATDIVSTATYRGEDIVGGSVVSEDEYLAEIVAMQAFDDVLTATNVYFPTGETVMSWTITLDVAGRGSRVYTRSQRYADRFDLFWDVIGDIAADVALLLDNPFREVAITDVEITHEVADPYRAYRIGTVQVRQAGKFRAVRKGQKIVAPRGRDLVVRTTLVPAHREAQVRPKRRTTRYPVARTARGTGSLVIQGNAGAGGFFFFDEPGGDVLSGLSKKAILSRGEVGPPRAKPQNLAQLLSAMAARPSGDDLSTSLAYLNPRARDGISVKSARRSLPAIVRGTFRLRVQPR